MEDRCLQSTAEDGSKTQTELPFWETEDEGICGITGDRGTGVTALCPNEDCNIIKPFFSLYVIIEPFLRSVDVSTSPFIIYN